MRRNPTRRSPSVWRATVVVLVAILASVVPGAFAAAAQIYGTNPPTVNNPDPAPGSQINFSASGFDPNSNVQVFFESTPVLLETQLADANGTVSGSATIPSDATPGPHDLVLTGTDPSGSPLSVSIPITVVAATTTSATSASSGGGLAFTGANIAIMVSVGVVALGFGGFLLLSVRRKRRAFEQ
jgi:hypothetical protein